MKDSILKGTGNSRFLKSAVPAGTSWADALAMLQAGTFPIDLNGINNAGFQQVGTPLNKANLLKDVTALTLGLTGDTVPNDMFNALAHAGDLHVWKKTVVIGSPVSAYFSLGDTIELTDPIIYLGDDSEASAYFEFSNKALTVRDNGTVDNNDDAFANVRFTRYVANDNKTFYPHNNASHEVYLSSFRGRYVRFYAISPYFNAPSSVEFGVWYYVPADATTDISTSSQTIRNNGIIISKLQKVIGHPYQPAGTTVTYPVSTNRNAYQEGNDAKPAGYVVGEVVTGRFKLEGYYNSSHPTSYYWASTPTVSDDGTVSIPSGSPSVPGYGFGESSLLASIRGKYLRCNVDDYSQGDFRKLGVVYIPENVVVLQYSSTEGVYIDRYQPVTGYAAIPANTTIEYLGCLGDKARVQVVSYVGMGTYGSSNPNSLTFDFVPKVVMFLYRQNLIDGYYSRFMQDATSYFTSDRDNVISNTLSTEYKQKEGFGYVSTAQYGKISEDKRTIYWYNNNQDNQANSQGWTYYYLAIG